MDNYIKNIDKQIESNQGKNMLHDDLEMFQFTDEMVKALFNTKRLTPESKSILINYTADKVIEEFCRVNQYYTFDLNAINELKEIYSALIESVQNKPDSIENISKNHFENLNIWLKKSNPFAKKIYLKAGKKITPVACSEYSQDLQVNVLNIDIEQLTQPVLDIGCGCQGQLVNYLKNNRIEVYGIDRFKFTQPFLKTADWLTYDYGVKKWGTILSNLGFSNHFIHHNLREDGNYVGYAKSYMNILKSLKIGGRFHYAPDLPFIEKYLDKNQFSIEKHRINELNFNTSIIKRIN